MRFLVVFLALFCLSTQAQTKLPEPVEIVQTLYKPYMGEKAPTLAPTLYPEIKDGWWMQDLTPIRRYATARLQGLINQEKKCREIELENDCMDYDVVINGQDYGDIKPTTTVQKTSKHEQLVTVSLYDDYDLEVRYFFVFENGAWRIDDVIGYKEGSERVLSEYAAYP